MQILSERLFRVEVDFLGISKDKAEILLRTYGYNTDEITAFGEYYPIDCGMVIGPGDKEYAMCKLVTPLINLAKLYDLKWIMNKFYSIGAMIAPIEPVKIHFLKGYSESFEHKIIRMLVRENKLLYTFLLYPRYSSLLSSDSQFFRLSDEEKLYHYKVLINTIDDKKEIYSVEALIDKILNSEAKSLYYNKLWQLCRLRCRHFLFAGFEFTE